MDATGRGKHSLDITYFPVTSGASRLLRQFVAIYFNMQYFAVAGKTDNVVVDISEDGTLLRGVKEDEESNQHFPPDF